MIEYSDYVRRSSDLYSDIVVYSSRIEINVFAGDYDENRVKNIIHRLQHCTMGNEYPILVIPDKNSRISFFAVKALASDEAMQYAKATAYVIKSFHQQVMADVLFSMYKTSKPVKVFKDVQSATNWLETFV